MVKNPASFCENAAVIVKNPAVFSHNPAGFANNPADSGKNPATLLLLPNSTPTLIPPVDRRLGIISVARICVYACVCLIKNRIYLLLSKGGIQTVYCCKL
ncbi:hypothetical protein ACFQWC_14790 [Rossellomorea sp. GCM10028870]|uniref:hypothetical protein n=1 Tax=Rossellomorea sp. GCM10028870 TaxID=3273426 RepID=UPI00361E151E